MYLDKLKELGSLQQYRFLTETDRRIGYTYNLGVFFDYIKESGTLIITDHRSKDLTPYGLSNKKHYVVCSFNPAKCELTVSATIPGIWQKPVQEETFSTSMGEDEIFQFNCVEHIFNMNYSDVQYIANMLESIRDKVHDNVQSTRNKRR